MPETTPRFALPLLAAGQAQKELFHNEAISALEVLTQTTVQSLGDNDPPAAPSAGQSWIVGTAPTGSWAGQASAFASWTEGGWRFTPATEGMTAWILTSMMSARYTGGIWVEGVVPARAVTINGDQVVGARQPAIAAPSGGSIVDSAARATLTTILAALRTHGLIAS